LITRKLGSVFTTKCSVKHEGPCFVPYSERPKKRTTPTKVMVLAQKFDPKRKFERTRKMMFLSEPASWDSTEGQTKRRKSETPHTPLKLARALKKAKPSKPLSTLFSLAPERHYSPTKDPRTPLHKPAYFDALPVTQRTSISTWKAPKSLSHTLSLPSPSPTLSNATTPIASSRNHHIKSGYPPIIGEDREKEVWRGQIVATPIPGFNARFLLIGGYHANHLALQSRLKVNGRIHFKTLNSFLPQMTSTSRKNVTFCEVHPTETADHDAYNQFCNHYKEIKRGAVYDQTKRLGWQVYIIPADVRAIEDRVFNNAFCCKPTPGIMTCLVIQYTDWKPSEAPPEPRRVRVKASKKPSRPRRRHKSSTTTTEATINTLLNAMDELEQKEFRLFASQTDPTKD